MLEIRWDLSRADLTGGDLGGADSIQETEVSSESFRGGNSEEMIFEG